jgi:hypothetical protein
MLSLSHVVLQRRLGSVVVAKDLVELQPPLLPSASARSRSYDGSMAHSSSVDNRTSALAAGPKQQGPEGIEGRDPAPRPLAPLLAPLLAPQHALLGSFC